MRAGLQASKYSFRIQRAETHWASIVYICLGEEKHARTWAWAILGPPSFVSFARPIGRAFLLLYSHSTLQVSVLNK